MGFRNGQSQQKNKKSKISVMVLGIGILISIYAMFIAIPSVLSLQKRVRDINDKSPKSEKKKPF
jgi:flagellar basal body-associated protein FliL